ncbi:putative ABC transporter ATP-binding protein YbhF [bacterium HR29]|jgi:ABC-2 type transport system ATP-binding protein|nr:putative ABC transporter ATP-binding protein YbhF [bacterium HR29]
MLPAIRTDGLTKRYGRVLALDGLALEVERGEVFGFLGPNGAGKTTTIRLLLDLIRPTAGRASILGHDCQRESLAARAQVGYLPGDLRLYDGLTARQHVALAARLRGARPDWRWVGELAERLGLDLDRKAGALSRGNKQKVGILLALFARPPVLILDEPTSGLDPLVQHAVHELLVEEARRGTAVFFSSHVMSEVERVCSRVAVLHRGRLMRIDTVEGLRARAIRRVRVRFDGAVPPRAAFDLPGVTVRHFDAAGAEFEVRGDFDPLVKALAQGHVADLVAELPPLEDVVVQMYEEGSA